MKNKKLDIIGVAAGVFLVLVLILNIVLGNANARANEPKIPDSAQTYATSAQGIFSEVKLETVADADGIYSVKVVEHGETPELGGVAAEELPAKIVEAQSVDVDGVTGATMTSNAIKAAVTEALVQAGFMEAPAVEEAVEEPAAEEPAVLEEAVAVEEAALVEAAAAEGEAQTLTVSKPGIGGDVVVEVVADANTIYSVEVVEHNETEGIGAVAAVELPGKIVEAQSADIDGMAGATITSTAIKTAVSEALAEVGFMAELTDETLPEEKSLSDEAAAAEEAAEDESAAEEAPAAEGEAQTLTVSKPGIGGDVVVEIVADASTIYSVEVVEQNETEGIGSVAAAELPGKIVAAQSADIDGMAGATITSTAIKTAVAEALAEVGFDPANAAAPAVAEEEPTQAEDVSYDVDVVVVGAGGAGMTAAISAKDVGMDVLVLESQALVGGNSVRSTGGMNAGKTEWQDANEFDQAAGVEATLAKVPNYADNERIQELAAIVEEQWAEYQADPDGYFDSVELFQLDTLIGGGGLNDPALVKTLAENSASAIEWLGELDPEVILHNVAAFGGASVKRIHRPVDEDGKVLSVGAYVVPLLKQNLESRGIELLLNTTAKEILVDENGVACGVVATGANGETVTVNAKAVVITTGGFGANNDMIASIRPELDGFITTNAPGIQGQGIQMAQAIGADTVDLEQIQLHPTVHVQDGSAALITEGLRGDGAILVNQEGERFFDEVSTRDKVSNAEFAQTGGYAWLIIDSRMSDASNVIQGYISKGFAETGETYEELAEAIGAPADVFTATMEKWNACVEAKEDAEFNRVSFANPLDQAPYYAIKVQPGIHHTMGGIKINDQAQVIDTEGNVIAGLFAAGEVTGGVHGNNRLGGNAVADFTIFGRIAGNSAAAYVSGDAVEDTFPDEEEAAEVEEAVAEEAEAEETPAVDEPQTLTVTKSGVFGDPVVVEIVADANTIYSVEVVEHNETEGIGAVAAVELPGKIVEAQSADVDGMTGATITSTAIKTAVAEALAEVGFAA